MAGPAERSVDLSQVRVMIFDLDGVVTDTASVHAAVWKVMFDEYLGDRSRMTGEPFHAFEKSDYWEFVDGKPRYDGVRSFLRSRDIDVPEGAPSDPPSNATVCGLGNRKDELFLAHLRTDGVERFESSVQLVRRLSGWGVKVAIVSASRNLREVLAAGGIHDLFDISVDGRDSDRMGLPGKPDPAIFLEAARQLGVEPGSAAVVEDSLAGVEAGRRGGFGVVVGVDRTGHAEALRERGADIVVDDLAELVVLPPIAVARIRNLPSFLQHPSPLEGRRPAVFLDYDGTLTPIVPRPEDAVLPESTRAALIRLAARRPVAILSGRDLDDVRSMVGVEGLTYAGSHGFDIVTADGHREQRGTEFSPDLDAAESDLRAALADGPPGAWVERKRFAIAVHYRQVDHSMVPEVARQVEAVRSRHPALRRTGGKMVFELRPSIEWDKGRALLSLIDVLGLGEADVVPLYIGDDETDEDAFRALRGRGIGIVVGQAEDERPTAATYRIGTPEEVRDVLDGLAAGGP
jgi:alpha,alpha-trehalase